MAACSGFLDQGASWTRRSICFWLGGAAGLAACGSAVTGSTPAPADDDALVATIVATPHARLPRRALPYRLTRPVLLPAGRMLTVAGGTHILFRSTAPLQSLTGVFQADGDGTGVVAEDSGAVIECSPPSVGVYAAVARGVNGFTVVGLHALNCNHVAVDARGGVAYTEVVTGGATANVSRSIRIERGGARFAVRPANGHAACLLRYCFDATVTDCGYQNVLSGVEWWGGDANPVSGDGAAGRERKCGRFLIADVSVIDSTISGIWGSMGHDGMVTRCSLARSGDVGFDAEGSENIVFRACTAEDGANGCFGTFFLNSNIAFVDCHARSTHRDLPVFRIHNPTLDMANNRSIVVRGGHWECSDPAGPSVMGTAGGPCGELTITGATLRNVRIDTAFIGVHRTEVTGNTLAFPQPFEGGGAIRVGGSKTLGSPAGGTVVVENNIVSAAARAPAAIEIWEDDPISSATSRISANRISGPFSAGFSITNASPNPAVRQTATLDHNRLALPRDASTLRLAASHPGVAKPLVHWGGGQMRDGRALTLHAALAG